MEFKWQHPELLWLGPALFVLVLLGAILFHRWRKKTWATLGLDARQERRKFAAIRYFTRHTLLALAALFLGLSLANLQMGGQKQKVNRKGTDVIFALDVSRSMLAEDIAPSRLDKAKLLISRSLGTLSGDRVGIVAYAGSAYPALPITTDYVAAKMALNAASPDAVPSQGTNLGAALEYAFGYFNPASPAGRFVVVFSDGEDHETLAGLEMPDFPVEILIVGLGTQSGGPIPIQKSSRGTTYKKDKNGEVVITKRDERVLSSLMEELGANYLDGNRTDAAVKGIEEFISKGEKADISEEIAIDYDPQFHWFLLPALLFLLLYLILPTKIGSPFKYGPLLLLLFAQSAFGQAADSTMTLEPISGTAWEYDRAINKGKALKENGDLQGASRELLDAVQMNPDGYEGWYNLGSTLMEGGMAEEGEAALKESVTKAQTDAQLSDALFNLGDAAFDGERYEEALNYYKESLMRDPTRKDAQYNFNRAYERLQQQKQEQNQQQNEDQEQQEQQDQKQKEDEKEPPKSDKDDPQKENPEDDNSKDKQDQQDQSGQDGEPNKDSQENENGDPEDNENSEKNEPEKGGESTAKMTPEEIKGLLEAIQRAEEKTAEKVTAKKAKGKKKSGEKDW
jgi:Ca-activated chloride channel family protein